MRGFTQPGAGVRRGLARRSGRSHNDTRGFIALVMLVLLALILGSLAMVARTSSGRLNSAAQGRNREARDVAEAGLTEIISELNKEPNRKLLVSGVALANWSQGAADLSNPLVNPCTRYNSSGGAGTIATPTTKAVAFKNGWQNLVAGDNTRSYRLVSVDYFDTARATLPPPPPDSVTSGQVKTLLRLTVQGRVSDAGGRVLSESRVVKEYEVVPKCCKRSFGRNSFAANVFGTDARVCFLTPGGILTASEAVAAVIGALNGGVINSSNNTLNVFDADGHPVTRVLCRSDVPSPGVSNPNCINGSMRLGTISVMPSRFGLTVPPWPGDDVTFTSLEAQSGSGLYVRVNPNTNKVEKCNFSGAAISSCQEVSSCIQVQNKTGYVDGYYCRLSSVNADKNSVVFDTSNGPLSLYFDSGQNPSSAKYFTYKGNASIKQVYCPAGGLSFCDQIASISNVERLNVYAFGSGSIDLNGADAAVTMNIFAPNASFSIKGGGSAPYNFIGRLWLNNIYANGSTTMQVLESAPALLVSQGSCTVLGCASIVPDAGGSGTTGSYGTPEVDWVARSVTYSSAF